jgi:PRTRC genetic system protein B
MNTPVINITEQFAQLYIPTKALLFYRHILNAEDIYIEKFNCNKSGRLIDAHPLSEKEISQLASLFRRKEHPKDQYLKCDGLLPNDLLYLNAGTKSVMWYTPCQSTTLYFTKSLYLQNGQMSLPMLIWKATATELFVFASTVQEKPMAATELYYAPFYNLHDNGRVCMGTVEINMNHCKNVQEFTSAWQRYFFNSKFSHLIGEKYPTKTPLPDLYRKLLAEKTPFPENELIPTGKTLQQIIP